MKKLLLLLLLAGFIFTGCKNDVGNGENDSVPYDEPEGEVYTIEGPGTDDDLTIMVKIDNQAITTEQRVNIQTLLISLKLMVFGMCAVE